MNKNSLKDKLIKSLKPPIEWNKEKDAVIREETNWYLKNCPIEYFNTHFICGTIAGKLECEADDVLQRLKELGLYG